jgi:tRNA-dihydrouridine synthase
MNDSEQTATLWHRLCIRKVRSGPPEYAGTPRANILVSHKPFLCLAPMDGITDTAFRRVVARFGAPDVFFTEFIRADWFGPDPDMPPCRHPERLVFSTTERPLVAQLWGSDPEGFFNAAGALARRGFDGIDINMGCPYPRLVAKGYGAGLIGNRVRAREIYLATKEGAGGLPVSIKTRTGREKHNTEEWCGFLLGLHPDALIIHGRYTDLGYDGTADWNEIARTVRIRDAVSPDTVLVGNGDCPNAQAAQQLATQSGVDGVMIGRSAVADPLCFLRNPELPNSGSSENTVGAENTANRECPRSSAIKRFHDLSIRTRVHGFLLHLRITRTVYPSGSSPDRLKKFVATYIPDTERELREALYRSKNHDYFERTLSNAVSWGERHTETDTETRTTVPSTAP